MLDDFYCRLWYLGPKGSLAGRGDVIGECLMSHGYLLITLELIRWQLSALSGPLAKRSNSCVHSNLKGTSLFVDFRFQFQVGDMIVVVFDPRSNEQAVLDSDGVGLSLRFVPLSHRCLCMDEARGFLRHFLFIGSPDQQTYNYHSEANHTMYNVLD